VQDSNNTLFLTTLLLPYFTITSNLSSPNVSYDVQCDGMDYLVQFDVMWTQFNFPSAFVIDINDSTPVSGQGVYTYDLKNEFQVIGPDFELFIETD
jgi:hypothetical protein